MDKRDDIIAKVKAYKTLVTPTFPLTIDKVYLFGSYAKGTPHKDSDIDVAFVVNSYGEDYDFLVTEPPLWNLKRQIDIRIEPHVVARDTDYAGFLDEIQRTGVEITN
jgi:predicted nucleotidyltransferase